MRILDSTTDGRLRYTTPMRGNILPIMRNFLVSVNGTPALSGKMGSIAFDSKGGSPATQHDVRTGDVLGKRL